MRRISPPRARTRGRGDLGTLQARGSFITVDGAERGAAVVVARGSSLGGAKWVKAAARDLVASPAEPQAPLSQESAPTSGGSAAPNDVLAAFRNRWKSALGPPTQLVPPSVDVAIGNVETAPSAAIMVAQAGPSSAKSSTAAASAGQERAIHSANAGAPQAGPPRPPKEETFAWEGSPSPGSEKKKKKASKKQEKAAGKGRSRSRSERRDKRGKQSRSSSSSSSDSESSGSSSQKIKIKKGKTSTPKKARSEEKENRRKGSPDTTKKKKRSQSRNSSRSSSEKPSEGCNGVSEDDTEVHNGTTCDGCKQKPIKGPRFRCATCKSLDLCHKCYKKRAKLHKPDHKFYVAQAIEEPAQRCIAKEETVKKNDNNVESSKHDNVVSALPQVSAEKMQELYANLGKTSFVGKNPLEEEQQKKKLTAKKKAKPPEKTRGDPEKGNEDTSPIKKTLDQINAGNFQAIDKDASKEKAGNDKDKVGVEEAAESKQKILPNFVRGEKVEVFSNSKNEWLEGVVGEVAPPDAVFPGGAFKVTSKAGTKWVGAETARAIMKKKATSTTDSSLTNEKVLAGTVDTLAKEVKAQMSALGRKDKASAGQSRTGLSVGGV